jgi:hypothetical protein
MTTVNFELAIGIPGMTRKLSTSSQRARRVVRTGSRLLSVVVGLVTCC